MLLSVNGTTDQMRHNKTSSVSRQCRKYLDQGAKHAFESRDWIRGIFVEDHACVHVQRGVIIHYNQYGAASSNVRN